MSDDAVDRLIRGLTLAEGFSLHVVLAESTRATDAFLERATAEISSARGAPPAVRRLTPYAAWSGVHDAVARELSVDDLKRTIAHPLLSPGPSGNRRRIDVVDASGELSTGTFPWRPDEAWGPLFDQLNEARNTIVATAERSLVLALPARLEATFAERAADFWALRSDEAVLTDVPRPQPLPDKDALLAACASAIRSQTYYERDDLRAIVEQDERGMFEQLSRAVAVADMPPLPAWEAETIRMALALVEQWSGDRIDWDSWDERAKHLTEMPKGSDPPDWLAFSALWLLEAMAVLAERKTQLERAALWAETAAMDHWGAWAGGIGTGASPSILRSIVGSVRANLAVGRMEIVRRSLGWARQLIEASPWERNWLEPDDPSRLMWPPSTLVDELGRLSAEAGDAFRAAAYAKYASMLDQGNGLRFREGR